MGVVIVVLIEIIAHTIRTICFRFSMPDIACCRRTAHVSRLALLIPLTSCSHGAEMVSSVHIQLTSPTCLSIIDQWRPAIHQPCVDLGPLLVVINFGQIHFRSGPNRINMSAKFMRSYPSGNIGTPVTLSLSNKSSPPSQFHSYQRICNAQSSSLFDSR